MNKKNIIIFSIIIFSKILFIPANAVAVSAYPYPIEFTQPDGSKITIIMKGDEKVRWAETIDSFAIMFNRYGTYEYARLNEKNDMIPSGIQAKNQSDRTVKDNNFLKNIPKSLHYSTAQVQLMKSAWSIYQTESLNAFPTTGNRNLVCILIGFTDKAFTKTNTDFNNLFNQINYTAGGATGSVKDYYLENSYNQLSLSVTVAGPYTASNTSAYYGANDGNGDDIRPRELVAEAVNLANPTVNYANFDNDNDGSVDGIYTIYAGYGEEAGGGANCIWAHAWNLATTLTLDGKSISRYSCSPELSGNSGTNITNIGVICHEFGHVLGAPDYYDVNYSTGGNYDGTGYWDLMASGSWNNGGKTPAHHNAYTKTMVYNWASAITINTGSQITLNNAAEYSNSFYRYNTTTTNEYFLIENRQQLKFDANIPGHGMIIYHVDGPYISTAGNSINAGSHQGMYPVCANASGNPTAIYGTINGGGCPFPGSASKTSFTDATTPYSKSWAGANTAKPITAITENTANKTITFNFMGGVSCTPPTTQASAFTSSNIANNSMTLGWTRGNGNAVIVIAKAGSAVNEIPANGTNYTANAAYGSGTQLGSGNYVIYNGTGTSVNLTALTSGTSYYFAVYEYNLTAFCYKTPALTGNATTTGIAPCSYCASSGNTSFLTSITRVNFNTINNITAKPAAYNDYSLQSTTVFKNTSYNLSVNINTDGNYTVYTYAWVDWNQDCDFSDAGESYNLGSVTNVTNGITSLCPFNITIPITALTGNTRMRVSAKFLNASTSCETGFDGEVEDYTINISAAASSTFTAAVSNAWETNENWNNGKPSSNTNVTIPANISVVINAINNSCNNLTILPLGKLSITTSNGLNVYGMLTLKSDASGTASLVNNGSLNSASTVAERYIQSNASDLFHQLSSPVVNQGIDTNFNPNNGYIYLWNEMNQSWNVFEDAGFMLYNGSNNFIAGRGYLISYPITTTKYFNGNLNNGTIAIPLTVNAGTYAGFNLVGNPYPSSINWNTAAGYGRTMLENAGGGGNAYWLWNPVAGNYGTYISNTGSGTNGTSNFIAPMQAYWVKASTAGSFSINNNAREHSSQAWLKSTNTNDFIHLKVSSEANDYADETIINFGNINDNGGAEKMFSMLAAAPNLYSVKQNKKWSISLLSSVEDNNLIPIGIIAGKDGNYTLSVHNLQYKGSLILEDLISGSKHNLISNPDYSFYAATQDNPDRFLLHLKKLTSDEISNENPGFSYNNQSLKIFNPWMGKALIHIYDVSGRLLHVKEVYQGNNNLSIQPAQGVYIIQLINNNKYYQQKLIVY